MDEVIKQYPHSARLFRPSRQFLGDGVCSGKRAASKPIPLHFVSGAGSHLTDVDDHKYIDYTLDWGLLILGHSYPPVVKAVHDQLNKCQLLSAQSELEWLVVEMICHTVPCAELVAFSNSGTEAVQAAGSSRAINLDPSVGARRLRNL